MTRDIARDHLDRPQHPATRAATIDHPTGLSLVTVTNKKTRKRRPWNERQKVKARSALNHFHSIGRTLRDCEHPMRLGRPATELLPLAREAGLSFPDADEVELETRCKARRSP